MLSPIFSLLIWLGKISRFIVHLAIPIIVYIYFAPDNILSTPFGDMTLKFVLLSILPFGVAYISFFMFTDFPMWVENDSMSQYEKFKANPYPVWIYYLGAMLIWILLIEYFRQTYF